MDNRDDGSKRWAADPVAGATNEILGSVECSFPVRLISTFELHSCDENASLRHVLEDPELKKFDHIPVTSDGEIIGLLSREQFEKHEDPIADGPVGTAMKKLSESVLISADAGILTFIESAQENPCRLVLDRTRVCGIVTISDLQRLAVRPVLFLLVTHVELLMARVIRDHGIAEAEWRTWLKPGRIEEIDEKWGTLSNENLAIDRLTATEFCDKREILRRVVSLGIGRNKLEDQLQAIEWLRNGVAHAGEYAGTRENAAKTIKAASLCREWIGRLSDLVAAKESSAN